MIDLASRITSIEKEIRETPYHKATEHYIGQLKAKLSKLKRRQTEAEKSRGGGTGFMLKKFGDATIILLGPPSVGKSTILNCLTAARSRVEAWPFSTVKVIPGMLQYQGAQIQLFDLPGVIDKATVKKGRSREIFSAARTVDLILLVVDLKTQNQIEAIKKSLKSLELETPILTVVNKADLSKKQILTKKQGKDKQDIIFISAETGANIEQLKKMIWRKLDLLRIYLKPKDGQPDFKKPLILKKGATVKDVAGAIFPDEKKWRQILLWGPSSQFPSQSISLNHELRDKDILSFN